MLCTSKAVLEKNSWETSDDIERLLIRRREVSVQIGGEAVLVRVVAKRWEGLGDGIDLRLFIDKRHPVHGI